MDKKILMLGLVISGNVFGMSPKVEANIANYNNQSKTDFNVLYEQDDSSAYMNDACTTMDDKKVYAVVYESVSTAISSGCDEYKVMNLASLVRNAEITDGMSYSTDVCLAISNASKGCFTEQQEENICHFSELFYQYY